MRSRRLRDNRKHSTHHAEPTLTEQLHLVDVPAGAKPLTSRQQLARDYVASHDGVTADEVGAWLHAHKDRQPHSVDVRCDWCARDGRSVLTSKALSPLLTYRRAAGGNLYLLRARASRSHAEAFVEQVSHQTAADPFAGL